MARTLSRLRGTRITGIDGAIGVLNDLYFDAAGWSVRYLALEPQSRFGARLVLPARSAPIEGIGGDELVVRAKRSAARRLLHPEPHLLSGREAESLRIHTAEGQAGRVEDVLIGIDWSIRAFVVATPSWVLPGSAVELAAGAVERVDRERGMLRVGLTPRDIQRLPRAAWRIRS